jgi:hypothetical protein
MAKSKRQMANGFVESGTGPAPCSWEPVVCRSHEPVAPESESLAGYREMANDHEHEAEALGWCEGLIGDAISRDG